MPSFSPPKLTTSQREELMSVLTQEAGGQVFFSSNGMKTNFQLPGFDKPHQFNGKENLFKVADKFNVDLLSLDFKKTKLGALETIQTRAQTNAIILKCLEHVSKDGYKNKYSALPSLVLQDMNDAGLKTSIVGSQKDTWEHFFSLSRVRIAINELHKNNNHDERVNVSNKILETLDTAGIDIYSKSKIQRSTKPITPNNSVNWSEMKGNLIVLLGQHLSNPQGAKLFINDIHAACFENNTSLSTLAQKSFSTPPSYMSPEVTFELFKIYQEGLSNPNIAKPYFDSLRMIHQPIGQSYSADTVDSSIREHLRNKLQFTRSLFLSRCSVSKLNKEQLMPYKEKISDCTEMMREGFEKSLIDTDTTVTALDMMMGWTHKGLFSSDDTLRENVAVKIKVFNIAERERLAELNGRSEEFSLFEHQVKLLTEEFHESLAPYKKQCPSIVSELELIWEQAYPPNSLLLGASTDIQQKEFNNHLEKILSIADGNKKSELIKTLNSLNSGKFDLSKLNQDWELALTHIQSSVDSEPEPDSKKSFKAKIERNLDNWVYAAVLGKLIKTQLPKQAAPKQEVAKQEVAKQEVPKQEEPKQAAPKQEVAKQEVAKQEVAKQEVPKQEEPKQAAPKQEEPKQAAPKQEVAKQEVPKQEVPKQEEPKQAAPKQEVAKQEVPKQETAKQEVPKQETAKQEVPKQEVTKQAAPKQEAAKQEELNKSGNSLSITEKIDNLQDQLTELFFDKDDELLLPDEFDWFNQRWEAIQTKHEQLGPQYTYDELTLSFEPLLNTKSRRVVTSWYENSVEKSLEIEKINKQRDSLITHLPNHDNLINFIYEEIKDTNGNIPEWVDKKSLTSNLEKNSELLLNLTISAEPVKDDIAKSLEKFSNNIVKLNKEWSSLCEEHPNAIHLWNKIINNLDFAIPKSVDATIEILNKTIHDKEANKLAMKMFDSEKDDSKPYRVFHCLERPTLSAIEKTKKNNVINRAPSLR